jgi:hypothetical protein
LTEQFSTNQLKILLVSLVKCPLWCHWEKRAETDTTMNEQITNSIEINFPQSVMNLWRVLIRLNITVKPLDGGKHKSGSGFLTPHLQPEDALVWYSALPLPEFCCNPSGIDVNLKNR